MPVSPDPNETWPYVLVEDRDKPDGQRRTLDVRYLTARQERQLDAALAATRDRSRPMTTESVVDAIADALRPHVAGVRGFEDDGGPAPADGTVDLRRYLTRADLIDVRDSIANDLAFAGIDRKNSCWLSRATSAKPAEQGATAGA